jgi:Tol biopolymer transport system component
LGLTARVTFVVLVLIAAGLAVPAVRHLREQPPPPPPPLRLALAAPPEAEFGSGDELLDAAISPDEQHIVFVATAEGRTSLWSRALTEERAAELPGTEGARMPAWNAAGDAVLFFAAGQLRQLTLADHAVRELAEVSEPSGAAWLADGSILFASRPDGAIQRLVDGAVSSASTLREGDRGHVFPSPAGDGSFVYTATLNDGRRVVRLVRGGDERDLTAAASHGQLVGEHVLYVRDDILLAQRFDGSDLGRTVPLASNVGVTPAGRGQFVASPRLLLSAPLTPRARTLTWFDWRGSALGTVGEPGDYWQVRLSPDDQFAAVTAVDPLLRTLDVDLVPTDGTGRVESLTLALAADSDPVWAPDGRRVMFRSLQSGRPGVFARRTHDPDAADEAVPGIDADATPSDWRSPTILFHRVDPASSHDIWRLDERDRSVTPVVKTGFRDVDGRLSPDGTLLAFVSDESGRPDVYVSRGSERVRASLAGGSRPRWSRDGRAVFFLRDEVIMRTTLDAWPSLRAEPAVPVIEIAGLRDFDVAHRRDALLVLVPLNGPPAASVSLLVDWPSALGQPR